jgi:hypothetical protein
MKKRSTFFSVVLLSTAAAAGAGCGAGDGALTFDEFKAAAYVEPDTGMYVLNGDELAEDVVQLRVEYERYLANFQAAVAGVADSEQGLTINRVGSRDDKWSADAAQNLTYCISRSSFGSRYAAAQQAMAAATAAWEGAGRINFVYRSDLDDNCTTSTAVVFNVRLVSRQPYLARSFFPSSSRRAREVLIDSSSFGSIAPYTLAGILRHELGHTLGFRHEHVRPEAGGACPEDTRWRAVTAYDAKSVMHYPQCNGTNRGDLVLTSLDRQGTAAVYP